jgi:hypothetical protein
MLVANTLATGASVMNVSVTAFSPTTGALVASFGSGGVVDTATGTEALGAAVQPDGDIDLAGSSTTTATALPTGYVIQLLPGGTPNSNFGSSGSATFMISSAAGFYGASLDASGQLVVVGASTDLVSEQSVIARVVVHRPPSISLAYTPANPQPGDTVTVTATISDPDGQVPSVNWSADGGTVVSSGVGGAQITFASPGSHSVTASLIDSDGFTAAAGATVSVAGVTTTTTSSTSSQTTTTSTSMTTTTTQTVTSSSGVKGTTTKVTPKPRRPNLHRRPLLAARGVVTVFLACPKGARPCKGSLQAVTTTRGLDPKLKVARGIHLGGADLKLAAGPFAIAAGHQRSYDLKLSPRAQALLKRLGHVSAQLIFTVGGGAAAARSAVSVKVVLERKPPKVN